jgi:hypothetical protein
MSDISVNCAVCGRHSVSIPARPGEYRVRCPNAEELNFKWQYSATTVRVHEDGSASSRQSSPGG